MQKAHLYEAILLVNRGVDEAVRGLERLKRAKDSELSPSCFDEELVLLEDHARGSIPTFAARFNARSSWIRPASKPDTAHTRRTPWTR